MPKSNGPGVSVCQDSQVIAKLGTAYDRINDAWEKAEADLRRFPIPYGVEHCFDTSENGVEYYLGYFKLNDTWRILYGSKYVGDDESVDYGWRAITDCSIGIRMMCVPGFSDLKTKVREAAESAVTEVHEAAESLLAMLER